jgi:queuine tRNA-ribosyltransferase
VPTPGFSFALTATDGRARAGVFTTPHGPVTTPAFMPVGTHGVVRGLSMEEVAAAGGQMILSNAYHLYLRPGDEAVRGFGGLHTFTRWPGPMLTDSGGFQVFSLAKFREVSEAGITFRSHLDGSLHEYTPERVMQIERNIGADVIMQLDELIAQPAEHAATHAAMERSLRWLARCRTAHERIARDDPPTHAQSLFPIVQGGTHTDLRRASVAGILGTGDWDGIAIGGVSVGEPKPVIYDVLATCDPLLPTDKPRYVMGVGFPDDLVEGVARGVDLFDCVAPTKMGRDGSAFTPDGTVQVRQSAFRTSTRPLVEGCPCPACTRFDRAYLRHLFSAHEDYGPRLLALHNLTVLHTLLREAHAAINTGTYASWSSAWLARYREGARTHAPGAND